MLPVQTWLLPVIKAVGRVVSIPTLVVRIAVQPFVPVTVTLKLPVEAVDTEGVVAVVFQKNVLPDVALAVKITLLLAQVKRLLTGLLVKVTANVLLSIIVFEAVAVQPLCGCVTVTVYVPAVVTAIVADVASLFHA